MPKSTSPHHKSLGDFGEKIAARYFQQKGYLCLERNYHKAKGEIDLIVTKNNEMTFVEVKTRLHHTFGPPEAAVNPYKKHKILRAIFAYLHEKSLQNASWKLDVIAIQIDRPHNTATLKHFSDILAA